MKRPSKKMNTLARIASEELMRLPGEKALKAITDSPRPVRLVQSLAEEDLYWLINDLGVDDALPILSLASNEQWQYLWDLDLWDRDRLDTGTMGRWLSLLFKADPERFLLWGLREQLELIELFLLRNVNVKIREHDQSPSDFDDDYFTLDDTFYIQVHEKNLEQTTRDFLERLSNHDSETYQKMLLELAGGITGEMEEEAYRLRNVRLAEKGFLPFEEAVGIYQYCDPERLRVSEQALESSSPGEPLDETTGPVTTSILLREQVLFKNALQNIEDPAFLERLEREFAALCNQLLCADSQSVRDKEALLATVAKACGYLSIGIDRTVGRNPEKALRLVQTFPLQDIFRVGFGAALALRWKTEKWLKTNWFVRQGLGLDFWDDTWAGMLKGLLKKRPLLYSDASQIDPYVEFRTLEDVMQCQAEIEMMIAADNLLSSLFPPGHLPRPDQAVPSLTYKSLLLTCWARHRLGLPENGQPISEEELKGFLSEPFFSAEAKQAFRDWLESRSGLTPGNIDQQVGVLIERLFEEIEEEYGTVSPENLDARYVKHFLIRP
jgi:hypothetical protein